MPVCWESQHPNRVWKACNRNSKIGQTHGIFRFLSCVEKLRADDVTSAVSNKQHRTHRCAFREASYITRNETQRNGDIGGEDCTQPDSCETSVFVVVGDGVDHYHADERDGNHGYHADDACVLHIGGGEGDEDKAAELEHTAGHLDKEGVEGGKAEAVYDYAAELFSRQLTFTKPHKNNSNIGISIPPSSHHSEC